MSAESFMGSATPHVSVPARVSDEELLNALRDFADQIDDVPSYRDMNESGPYSTGTYQNHFGSWSGALEAAGLDKEDRSSRKQRISEEELLTGLQEFADRLGKRPTTREMENDGPHSVKTYKSRFGSWSEALDAAGFDTSVRYSRRHLLNALRDLDERVEGPPTQKQMAELGEFSPSVYDKRFESWGAALEEAGVDLSQKRPNRTTPLSGGRREISIEALLAELHTLRAELGHAPTSNEMDDFGAFGQTTYRDWFGSWGRALHAAGIDTNTRQWYSDSELLAELTSLADELGRTPKAAELSEKTPLSHSTYQNRFGSWNEAVEAAGLEPVRVWGGQEVVCWYCGEEFRKKHSHAERHEQHFCDSECMGRWQSENYRGEGNPRWAGGYENYYGENWEEARRATLSRDDFSCESCGLGRKDHVEEFGRDLHVHHIQPMRTFGTPEESNTLDNLVTLCESCHSKWEGIPLRPQRAD